MSKVHEGTLNAYITQDYNADGAMSDDSSVVLRSIHLSPHENMANHGWTRVGTARVEVTLVGKDVMVENKIESLKAEKQKILADAQLKVTQIEEKIQNLLAISFDPS